MAATVESEALAPCRLPLVEVPDGFVDTELRHDEVCKLVGVHGLRVELGQFLGDFLHWYTCLDFFGAPAEGPGLGGLATELLETQIEAMLRSR